jgi:hypothetical protein
MGAQMQLDSVVILCGHVLPSRFLTSVVTDLTARGKLEPYDLLMKRRPNLAVIKSDHSESRYNQYWPGRDVPHCHAFQLIDSVHKQFKSV